MPIKAGRIAWVQLTLGILQLITNEEAKEGLDTRMDRRSLKRLLARLSNEGQIKLLRVILRSEDDNRTRALNFICKPGIDLSNSIIRSAVDQAKLKLFCIGKSKMPRNVTKPSEKPSKPEKLDFREKLKDFDPSISSSVKQVKEQLAIKK